MRKIIVAAVVGALGFAAGFGMLSRLFEPIPGGLCLLGRLPGRLKKLISKPLWNANETERQSGHW
jgi:hypothetical protein